jgi:hypothetical protein
VLDQERRGQPEAGSLRVGMLPVLAVVTGHPAPS